MVFSVRIRALAVEYYLLVIDTPPTMGFAVLAPLLASDVAFAPIIPDAYSVKGIESLIVRVDEIRQQHNPGLTFLGLMVNKWRRNSRAQNDTVARFRSELGEFLIPYSLAESAAIADAAHAHRPVWRNARSGSQRRTARDARLAFAWVLERTITTAEVPQ